jgi:hypothetical protein
MVAVPAVPTFAAGQKLTAAALTTLAQATTFAIARPCAIATRTTTQSIPNTTRTAVTFDTESYDNDGLFTAGTTTITITRAGVWEIESFVAFASNATGMRWNAIFINGVLIQESASVPATGGNSTPVLCYMKRVLVVGDAVTTQVLQSSGGALNIDGSTDGAHRMSATFIAG